MCFNDLMQLKWSDRVLNEWIDNLIKNRPDLSRERLEKTKKNMNDALLDCLVLDYENIEKDLCLPDLNDKHVLAAAIASKSNVIVTANLKDFPDEELLKFKMKACHPDELFMMLVKMHKDLFLSSVKECYQKLRNPPISIDKYILTLSEKCCLVKTGLFLRQNIDFLQ